MEKLLQFRAGFVKCKCRCKNDVIDLKWLLLEERIDSSILKLVYKQRKHACKFKTRIKRTNQGIEKQLIAKDKNMNKSTIIDEANEIFKELPSNIKQEIRTMSSYSFKEKLKKYMFDRTLASALSSQI